jgi:RNA polymerase sigma-70 factor (ECF subfamily)
MVFRSLYGKMKVVCLRYASDADAAEDLLQEGFIKVFEKIANYNNQGSFEGWVRRIMVNNAIDNIRKNKTLFLDIDNDRTQAQVDREDDDYDEPEYLSITPDQILAAMQHLSPAYRAVFNLYVMENLSHQDIAEQLGISVGTSKSNLAKARMNLKKILETELKKAHERG